MVSFLYIFFSKNPKIHQKICFLWYFCIKSRRIFLKRQKSFGPPEGPSSAFLRQSSYTNHLIISSYAYFHVLKNTWSPSFS